MAADGSEDRGADGPDGSEGVLGPKFGGGAEPDEDDSSPGGLAERADAVNDEEFDAPDRDVEPPRDSEEPLQNAEASRDDAAELFAELSARPAALPPRPRRNWIRSGVVGIAVLVVLAIVCAGLIVAVVVKTRNDAATAAREAAAYTPPPLTTSVAPAADGVAVVSDGSASSAAAGISAARRWPQLLGKALGTTVDLAASPGAGYTKSGRSGSTFVDDAAKVPSGARVVLFIGGSADEQTSALALARAATHAFAAAAEQAPDATIVAIGPLFRPDSSGAEDFGRLRTTLRSAAGIANVRWVDPVDSDWISSTGAANSLSAADEREIATRLQTIVQDPTA